MDNLPRKYHVNCGEKIKNEKRSFSIVGEGVSIPLNSHETADELAELLNKNDVDEAQARDVVSDELVRRGMEMRCRSKE